MNFSHYEKLKFDSGLRFHVCKYIMLVQIAVLHSSQQQATLLPRHIDSHLAIDSPSFGFLFPEKGSTFFHLCLLSPHQSFSKLSPIK